MIRKIDVDQICVNVIIIITVVCAFVKEDITDIILLATLGIVYVGINVLLDIRKELQEGKRNDNK